MSKIAVILFNLGGPDSKEAIKPFLFNFFRDKNIIRLPLPLRWGLAKYISIKRGKGAALKNYAYLNYRSPLLENTKKQATALEKSLGQDYKTFVCMRYWNPRANEVVQAVKAYNPDKIILLPLYPQYSTATTKSAFEDWERTAKSANLDVPTQQISSYPVDEGFIEASVDHIEKSYKELTQKTDQMPRLLFSAHGLPESVIKSGDPYQEQCEQSAAAIITELGHPPHLTSPRGGEECEDLASDSALSRSREGGDCFLGKKLDWSLCYQSRVGPKKWIGPSTEEELHRAADDNVPVLIYPLAFTQEHIETLVEIEIEYRKLARDLGVLAFARVPTVGTHPAFIEGLAALVRNI